MKPLYKVGDQVLVKSEYDAGCDEYNYRYTFTPAMLTRYGGTVCTIASVRPTCRFEDCQELKDDHCCYRLLEDTEGFHWSSSMFEPEF